jgi:hypothetical protein
MPQSAIPIRTGSDAAFTTLNLAAPGAVVKASPGRVMKVMVNTAGSGAGAIYDRASLTGVAAANLLFSIPNTAGVYILEAPCANGITVVPGTAQVVAVTYI